MNRTEIRRLANTIEKLGNFNLSTYASLLDSHGNVQLFESCTAEEVLKGTTGSCGTVACVCGFQNARKRRQNLSDMAAAARDLGLTWEQGNELFVPDASSTNTVWGRNPYSARAPRAARVLREIADGKRTFLCDREAAKRKALKKAVPA